MNRRSHWLRASEPVPVWRKDYSGGLVPQFKSSLASWTRTGGVSWDGTRVAIADAAGTAQSLQSAFTPPAENYIADVIVEFAGASNTLAVELLSAVSGTVRFSAVIDATTNTIVINGTDDVTPAGYDATTAHRLRFVVRPSVPDVIAFCYYTSVDHVRLETGGGTRAWTTSGSIGAYSLKTDTTGTGTVYVSLAEIKPILAVIIGDSISTGHDSGASGAGYDPTPYLVNGRSGPTHTVKWYIERLYDHEYTIVSQGTGGDTLNDMSARRVKYITDVLEGMSTKVCLIMAGTNDIAGSASAALCETRLNITLSWLATNSVDAIVAEVLPRDTFDATKENHRQDFNTYVRSLESATVKAAQVITNVPELADPSDSADINPVYASDGVHPNWSGYQVMAPEWVRAWESL